MPAPASHFATSSMSSMYLAQSHHTNWHNPQPQPHPHPHPHYQYHLFPPNPYPLPPPPPIAHKVWILDCKSCATFLTNRGMKAVLLLRPNVSLYSSDALPVNCSAYTTNPDVLQPRATCNPRQPSHIPPRTCECLTQTLCCHGCGATVGYMIVIPCIRCTSSITATNRATNGHRFVFHSSEVIGTERRYVSDEPGVIPFESGVMPAQLSQPHHHLYHYPAHHEHASPHQQPSPIVSENHTAPSSPLSEYIPTPPLEYASLSVVNALHPPDLPAFLTESISGTSLSQPRLHVTYPQPASPSPQNQYPHSRPILVDSPSPAIRSPRPLSLIADTKEHQAPRKLKAGDMLFWHHLARTGEIPGVTDDIRARSKVSSPVYEELGSNVAFNR